MDNSNERSEQYRYVRHDKLFVQIKSNDKSAATVFCHSCNASSKGINIELDTELSPGTQIELWISFEGMDGKFYLSGVVRWCGPAIENENAFQLGVELEDALGTDYEKWMELLVSFSE